MGTNDEYYTSMKTEQYYSIDKSETSKYATGATSWPANQYEHLDSSVTDSIESSRGFKPSDRKDPCKREFLQNLTKKVFKVGLDENVPPNQRIDLQKIFTPAEGEQIKPKKNKKLFASSAFYEKGLHPTVEDQVELAKRISQSLSDQKNKSSKGQSMFVNRKKRSVKWVHEGEGKNDSNGVPPSSETKKNSLQLVMNPFGQLLDIKAARKQGYNFEPALSPQVCLKIVEDLNAPKGKGAELFAKRRKRSEKWVVSESNGTKTSPESAVPVVPPSPIPTEDTLNTPHLRMVKSPWDAVLETGSVEAAFEQEPLWPTVGQNLYGSDPQPRPTDATPAQFTRSIDFSNLKNYNTTPKTWGEAKSIYRTITNKYLSYSDL